MEENNRGTQTADKTKESALAALASIAALLKLPEGSVDQQRMAGSAANLWELEGAGNLEPEDQRLAIIAIFIYTAHRECEELNIKLDDARQIVAAALGKWQEAETAAAVAAEKAAANPFKSFVDTQQPRVDAAYPWQGFMLEHLKSSDKEWTYKMKKCWFSEFFIRYGRTDYLGTACLYDQLPANARKDYVKLKLHNLFPNWGSSCTFQYTPVKP